jgi:hypothetical protein
MWHRHEEIQQSEEEFFDLESTLLRVLVRKQSGNLFAKESDNGPFHTLGRH